MSPGVAKNQWMQMLLKEAGHIHHTTNTIKIYLVFHLLHHSIRQSQESQDPTLVSKCTSPHPTTTQPLPLLTLGINFVFQNLNNLYNKNIFFSSPDILMFFYVDLVELHVFGPASFNIIFHLHGNIPWKHRQKESLL